MIREQKVHSPLVQAEGAQSSSATASNSSIPTNPSIFIQPDVLRAFLLPPIRQNQCLPVSQELPTAIGTSDLGDPFLHASIRPPPSLRNSTGQRYEFSTYALTPSDVLKVRNALKLSGKFFAKSTLPWSQANQEFSCAHVAEVGVLLIANKCHPAVIQAGLLYPTLIDPQLKDSSAPSVIEKKFGTEVLNLVREMKELVDLPEQDVTGRLAMLRVSDPQLASQVASLHCAVSCARSVGMKVRIESEELDPEYIQCGVPVGLRNQLHLHSGRVEFVSPYDAEEEGYSASEIIEIRNALRVAAVVYQETQRKWGPEEKMPLIAHAAEVGLLLLLAEKSRDLVISGFLHDFLEGYSRKDFELLSQVVESYGSKVKELVENVTEPTRRYIHGVSESRGEWLERKLAIVERMRAGSDDFADLCAATKISTVAAGNKMLFSKGNFEDWSNGSWDDNINVFISIRETYGQKGSSPLLEAQLDLEMTRLILSKREGKRDESRR